jgi:hypothetical protein
VVDDLEQARLVSKWMAGHGRVVSPILSKKMAKRYDLPIPEPKRDNFRAGIKSGKYPRKLLHPLPTNAERDQFLQELREGAVGTALALPTHPLPHVAPDIGAILDVEEPASVEANAASAMEPNPIKEGVSIMEDSKEHDVPSDGVLQAACPPLEAKSPLLRDMVSSLRTIARVEEEAFYLTLDRMKQLSQVDGELSDLLHIAEFVSTLATPDAHRLYRAIQEARERRRILKDELTILEKLSAVMSGKSSAAKALGETEALSHRKYRMRQLSEVDVRSIIHGKKALEQLGLAVE